MSRLSPVIALVVLSGTLAARLPSASAAVPESCPPPAGGAPLELVALPDPVRAGAQLVYCINVGSNLRGPGKSLRVALHLPPGSAGVDPVGMGYACTLHLKAPDQYQRAKHLDVECASLVVGLASGAITVRAVAPRVAGTVVACATAGTKGDEHTVCRPITVAP